MANVSTEFVENNASVDFGHPVVLKRIHPKETLVFILVATRKVLLLSIDSVLRLLKSRS